MFTLSVVYLIILLAFVAYHYRSIAKYANIDAKLKNANKRLAAYRKANREYESAYNALLAEYNRVCWELSGYADNVERIAKGEIKRIVEPVALGEVSAMPMFPLFVDSNAVPMFDQDGAIVFAPGKPKEENGDKNKANGKDTGAKSENAEKQAESTPNAQNSNNAQNRDLAAVIVEVGQALKDTLSDKEKDKIKEWLGRESMKNAPASEYAKNIAKMRNGNKGKGK